MPFQKGQSGNPSGQGRVKPFRDALRMEAIAAENGEECVAKKGSLRWNARQLLDRGDPVAIRELADRLDGRVPTPIAGADGEGPVEHEMTFRWLTARDNEKSSSPIYPESNSPASTNEPIAGDALSPTAEPERQSPA